jgi:hypothetical protein
MTQRLVSHERAAGRNAVVGDARCPRRMLVTPEIAARSLAVLAERRVRSMPRQPPFSTPSNTNNLCAIQIDKTEFDLRGNAIN